MEMRASVLILFYYFPTEFARAISMIMRNGEFFHSASEDHEKSLTGIAPRRVFLSQMHLDVVFRERIRAHDANDSGGYHPSHPLSERVGSSNGNVAFYAYPCNIFR